MDFGSVCSGIEAASVAWRPLGWRAAWFAEIEPFPSAVLAHHYPGVTNHGDMSHLPLEVLMGDVEAPDILCGGTPCQAFSVAGLRRSLDDARGNLSLIFTQLANAIDDRRTADGREPCIVFWENVPGVLNTKDNAFGCFLAGLAGEDEALQPAGPRWTDCGVVFGPARTVAWRVLDAQYFGLAQRRRRVFVVASARGDFDPVAVLLEFDGVRRDLAPSRSAQQDVAPTTLGGARKRGGYSYDDLPLAGGPGLTPSTVGTLCAADGKGKNGQDAYDGKIFPVTYATPAIGCIVESDVASCLTKNSGGGGETQNAAFVTHSLRAEGFDASEDGTGRGTPLVAFHPTQDPISSTDGSTHAMGCGSKQGSASVAVAAFMQARRLTPRECERLQGFPDDYTLVTYRNKPAADGPRYKALGNSWAVPVVRWIGRRIHLETLI